MNRAIVQFRENIRHVRNLRGIYTALRGLTTGALDLSDILRAQIVMAVSAMDTYVHAVARIGMVEIYVGARPATDAYRHFAVSLDCASQLAGGATGALETEIRRLHGFQTFQDPKKIADAVRLVSAIQLWNSVSAALGEPPDDVKQSILLIVQRRNKIAHEADVDPVFGGRWPINEPMVDNAIDRIERVCEVIQTLL